jgi:phytoene dehydrogenase-like protein
MSAPRRCRCDDAPKDHVLAPPRSRRPPEDFVTDIEHWRSRSSTGNPALDRRPDFACKPGGGPEVHGGTIVLADSIDQLEGAFQDAAADAPAYMPFAYICITSVLDPTIALPGKQLMSMFTQWVPHDYSATPHAPSDMAEIYARCLPKRYRSVPGLFAGRGLKHKAQCSCTARARQHPSCANMLELAFGDAVLLQLGA